MLEPGPQQQPPSFRFGELRERTLHRQLKALYCPDDGQAEWPVCGAIADLWSPTLGVIEIQTRTLFKLRGKVAAYLDAGYQVLVVHPLAGHRTIATWNQDRSQLISKRKSPKVERVQAAFREIGSLSEFLLHPAFRIAIPSVRETEHRVDDGKGSWRRQGKSKVDRVLDEVLSERQFACAEDYQALIPAEWEQPGTAATLSQALRLSPGETQALISCFKKLGLLEVCGKQGRAQLLRQPEESNRIPRGVR